jgi:hypothetical protein
MKILYSTIFRISLSHFDLSFDGRAKNESFGNPSFYSLDRNHDLHHFHVQIALTRALLALSVASVGVIDVLSGTVSTGSIPVFLRRG